MVVTHAADLAMKAGRVIRLRDGKVVADSSQAGGDPEGSSSR